jgi:hypothetical protein
MAMMKPPFLASDKNPPIAGLVPVPELCGEDDEDTALLREMSHDAEGYLRSFSWCMDVRGAYYGGGVGGVFAIFLFNIQPSRQEVGTWMWTVVGDVPSAYLPVEDASTAKEVFTSYVRGLSKWIELARLGQSGTPDEGVPPINVPPTPEWADKLEHRLQSLVLIIKPFFDDDKAESEYVN